MKGTEQMGLLCVVGADLPPAGTRHRCPYKNSVGRARVHRLEMRSTPDRFCRPLVPRAASQGLPLYFVADSITWAAIINSVCPINRGRMRIGFMTSLTFLLLEWLN